MQAALAESERLRARLQQMVDEDVAAFGQVMAAYRLSRETEEEKATRAAAIQAALRVATCVPLDCARACVEVIELSQVVAEKGNRNVVSDVGAGVASAHAGLRSAALNVYINTGSIDDESFAREQLEELEALLARAEGLNERVYGDVVRALG